MSRMTEEMDIIPRPAWAIAVICFLGAAFLGWQRTYDDDGTTDPVWVKVLVVGVIPLLLMIWVLLIGYVNGDARRRGMQHVMWTLLAIFIPSAIGIILYFVMRGGPMKTCSKCRKTMNGEFAFCPDCGAETAPSCHSCKRAIEPEWLHCPSCGKGLRTA